MRLFQIPVVVVAFSVAAIAQQPQQTPAQIQQQKTLADQMPVAAATAEFRTPLKTFETYYSLIVGVSASEFRCLTPNAMQKWFGKETLSEAGLAQMRADDVLRDETDHVLIEFRYLGTDPNKPKVTFGWRYNYKDNDGQRIEAVERQELTFVRTDTGWKIDLVNAEPTP